MGCLGRLAPGAAKLFEQAPGQLIQFHRGVDFQRRAQVAVLRQFTGGDCLQRVSDRQQFGAHSEAGGAIVPAVAHKQAQTSSSVLMSNSRMLRAVT